MITLIIIDYYSQHCDYISVTNLTDPAQPTMLGGKVESETDQATTARVHSAPEPG